MHLHEAWGSIILLIRQFNFILNLIFLLEKAKIAKNLKKRTKEKTKCTLNIEIIFSKGNKNENLRNDFTH